MMFVFTAVAFTLFCGLTSASWSIPTLSPFKPPSSASSSSSDSSYRPSYPPASGRPEPPTQAPVWPVVPGKSGYDRIVVVVMENMDFDVVAANPIFQTFASSTGILLDNYSAVTHPSQPNYFALTTGQTLVWTDLDSWIPSDVPTIADLLELKNVSWATYQEDYPGNCFQGSSFKGYRRKHNPFISFQGITDSPHRCARIQSDVDFDQKLAAFDEQGLDLFEQFIFYVPNMDNDGHDTNDTFCGNYWANTLLPKLQHPVFTNPNTLLSTLFVLTWDEDANWHEWWLGRNRIYTVLFSSGGNISTSNSHTSSDSYLIGKDRIGTTDSTYYTHYSLLKTIEDNWDLGSLGANDQFANGLKLQK